MNYFQPKELECKCGCGRNNFSDVLLKFINQIREYINKPLIVKSACRCDSHNEAVGGVMTSDHIPGEGVDLECLDSRTRFNIIFKAMMLGCVRIGVYDWGIHLGINVDNPQRVLWRGKDKYINQ